MTPEQEAQRLIDLHKKVIKNRTDVFVAYSYISFAKECAAITVKRIQEFVYAIPINDETFLYREEQLERWQEVLKHIKKNP